MALTRTPFGLAGCGHCTAVADDTRRLLHDDTCPVGRDLDDSSADDRAWFEAHPGQSVRHRPPFWSETLTLAAVLGVDLPPGATWHGHVTVRQVAPGVRARNYDGVYAVLPTTEAVAK